MAEFGENIRKAREKAGITQQTLADKLYVTRQAVSRWENGSRYPDLLTAKSLAKALDTSLDELLRDDDMRTYPEVNPVLEYPLHKRVQTALFAAAFATNLIMFSWYIGFILTESRVYMTDWEGVSQIVGAVTTAIITGVLLYGMIKSIKDTVKPNIAARIAVMIVGTDMLNELAVHYCNYRNNTTFSSPWYTPIYQLIDAAFIVSVLVFFCGKKPHSPVPVYILSGIVIISILYSYLNTFIGQIGTPQVTRFVMVCSLRMVAVLLIPILFIYMTAVLHRKRRLAESSIYDKSPA